MILQWLLGICKRDGPRRARLGIPNAFIGSFELRVNRLVGWVKDKYGSDVVDMQIEVFRSGARIAVCSATKQPKLRRFEFNLAIEGLLTGEELVKELVTVFAYDSEGNSGQIRLDGASQIELIRDHLGAPTFAVFDLDFSSGGNARPFLGAGWSGTESDFTWTENDDSYIRFNTPAEAGICALRLTAGAAIHAPEVPEQELLLFINETEIGHIRYNQAHAQFNECRFAHEAFGNETQSTLRLHHPNAMRPCDLLPVSDARRLAFRFKRISLNRMLPL